MDQEHKQEILESWSWYKSVIFISGTPATLFDHENPDCAPTINMGMEQRAISSYQCTKRRWLCNGIDGGSPPPSISSISEDTSNKSVAEDSKS